MGFQEIVDALEDNPDSDEHEKKFVEYLKEHPEDTRAVGSFLFKRSLPTLWKITSRKRQILNEVLREFPERFDDIVKDYFETSDDSFDNPPNYYIKESIRSLSNIVNNNTITFDRISEYFNTHLKEPYTLFQKALLREFDRNLRKINPNLYIEYDKQLDRLKKIVLGFGKTAYCPVVVHEDSCNPRVSKFGGVAPYLPAKAPKICSDCKNVKLQLVFSFYVNDLPEQIRSLFPAGHEYVVAGYTCDSCYLECKVDLFVDDEIDQLCYDSVPNEVFNEPRVVTGWTESISYPQNINEFFEVPSQLNLNLHDLYLISELIENSNDGPHITTYLGGYPIFIQGDDSPADHVLFLEMEESEASTNMWGDCGTAQVWMSTGDNFGSFVMQYACS